jgi:hypothetical protein
VQGQNDALNGHLVSYVQTIFRFGKPSNYITQYGSKLRDYGVCRCYAGPGEKVVAIGRAE